MQSSKVPVVMYENGKRFEVGTAEVVLEGKNIAIMAEVLPAYSEWMLPKQFEVSLSEVMEHNGSFNLKNMVMHGPDSDEGKIILAMTSDTTDLDEVDRCARAYGWEVGRGRTLVQGEIGLSEDNPFRSSHWKDGVPV